MNLSKLVIRVTSWNAARQIIGPLLSNGGAFDYALIMIQPHDIDEAHQWLGKRRRNHTQTIPTSGKAA
ncbi:hypothetical protein EYC98_14690 [Halieaceae bacterium IMCC14734]|uniref:Uncharacterized protein n=1 Tax=Candidatus Litorirhabdus singularis TaxID=2518993 RepID=A0ABT3TIE2_9GAMM|nr:hypothetical protein [Candidatus Litorirhabdus singularis]MCX2982106.1 hypothetical protein [Candidatus Litorirhabdus singularis]